MKHIKLNFFCFVLGITALLSIACQQKTVLTAENSDVRYEVKGTIKGASDSSLIILKFFGLDRKYDSAYVIKEKFHFAGHVPEPMLATLRYGYYIRDLMLENSPIEILGTDEDFSMAEVLATGENNRQLHSIHLLQYALSDSRTQLSMQIDSLKKKAAIDDSAIILIEKQLKEKNNESKNLILNYMTKNGASRAAIGFYLMMLSLEKPKFNPDQFVSIYDLLTDELKKSLYGKYIAHIIELERVCSGKKPFYEIEGLDTAGKQIRLSSLKDKYVLVDFWASWCAPCRKENVNLKKAYQTYHHKGFTILGISLDDSKASWIAAINKDELAWNNICDFKGMDNKLVYLKYGVRGVPSNFLLDRNGIVIGQNLMGDSLMTMLSQRLN